MGRRRSTESDAAIGMLILVVAPPLMLFGAAYLSQGVATATLVIATLTAAGIIAATARTSASLAELNAAVGARLGWLGLCFLAAVLAMLGGRCGQQVRAEEAAAAAREAAEQRVLAISARQAAEARRQEAAAVELQRLAAIAREAARPPTERAALASAAIADATVSDAEAIARARALLDPIAPEARGAPDVRRAMRQLAQREADSARRDREAREAARGLLCNDDTYSPTCRCHGPHGGCCSHHGGIRGCEPID